MKEQFKLMGLSLVWWIFFLVVGVATTIGLLVIRPQLLDLKTKQNQNSYEYITTVQEVLVNDLVQWKQLDAEIQELSTQEGKELVIESKKAQQASLVVDMQKKAMRIDSDQVPFEVSKFLATH